jgi:hypothetical protein
MTLLIYCDVSRLTLHGRSKQVAAIGLEQHALPSRDSGTDLYGAV